MGPPSKGDEWFSNQDRLAVGIKGFSHQIKNLRQKDSQRPEASRKNRDRDEGSWGALWPLGKMKISGNAVKTSPAPEEAPSAHTEWGGRATQQLGHCTTSRGSQPPRRPQRSPCPGAVPSHSDREGRAARKVEGVASGLCSGLLDHRSERSPAHVWGTEAALERRPMGRNWGLPPAASWEAGPPAPGEPSDDAAPKRCWASTARPRDSQIPDPQK